MAERTYGWSPEQLARINVRREARGKEAYIDSRFDDPEYAKRYIGQSESYAEKMRKRIGTSNQTPSTMPLPAGGEEPELSLKDRSAKRTEDFRKKFAPTNAMGIKAAVKSEASKLKGKPMEIERSLKAMGTA